MGNPVAWLYDKNRLGCQPVYFYKISLGKKELSFDTKLHQKGPNRAQGNQSIFCFIVLYHFQTILSRLRDNHALILEI